MKRVLPIALSVVIVLAFHAGGQSLDSDLVSGRVEPRIVLPPTFSGAEIAAAGDRAIESLIALQDASTGLIDSYNEDDDLGENEGVAGLISFLFDQAIALIALSHAGQTNATAADAAEALAQFLIDTQESAGFWWASYGTTTGVYIHDVINTGPNAWAGFALIFYATTLAKPNSAAATDAAAAFAEYAIDALRDGAMLDQYDYWWGDAPGEFMDGKFYSTEINLDMWWLLRSLGENASFVDPLDETSHDMNWWADRLWSELTDETRAYWNTAQERWNLGPGEAFVSEDVQSWGSVTDFFAGAAALQNQSLDFAIDPSNNLISTIPSYGTTFYGSQDLVGMEDNVNPAEPAGSCTVTIWNEGSAHMACALYYAGRDGDATSILNSLIASETEIAGLRGWTHSLETSSSPPCSSNHFGPNFGIHAGATAWAYFAIQSSTSELLPYRLAANEPMLPISGAYHYVLLALAIVLGSRRHFKGATVDS